MSNQIEHTTTTRRLRGYLLYVHINKSTKIALKQDHQLMVFCLHFLVAPVVCQRLVELWIRKFNTGCFHYPAFFWQWKNYSIVHLRIWIRIGPPSLPSMPSNGVSSQVWLFSVLLQILQSMLTCYLLLSGANIQNKIVWRSYMAGSKSSLDHHF